MQFPSLIIKEWPAVQYDKGKVAKNKEDEQGKENYEEDKQGNDNYEEDAEVNVSELEDKEDKVRRNLIVQIAYQDFFN